MQSLKFLFWNLNKKHLVKEITELALERDIDVIVLAEVDFETTNLLLALNQDKVEYFPENPISQCQKIRILSKFNYDFIAPISEDTRLTIRELTLPYAEKMLIVAVHLVDKMSQSEKSQHLEAAKIVQIIRNAEIENNTERTLIVGDFNMNPFEDGMIQANSFNAVMSSKMAEKQSITIQEKQYGYFYNPMWSLFGDVKNVVPGSYHYRRNELVNHPWNIFDQVLIRPSLLPNFDKSSLHFVDNVAGKTLLTKSGTPNSKNYSDHLPLVFTINLPNHGNIN